MLIVAGEMVLSAGGISALRSICASHRAATEAEAGCARFSLGVADEAAGLVTVLEMWHDEEALLSHHEQPHTARFLELVGPHIQSMDLRLYESDEGHPLPAISSLDNLQAQMSAKNE